jgi:surface carbohydrate biosynthesis protein
MSLNLFAHHVRKLFRARKVWRRPRRAHVLFFGSTATHVVQTNIVLEQMREDAVEVFDPEVICVPLAVISFFSRERYLRHFIAAVQPRVCVTCMDNDVSFWDLKRRFPAVTTVLIQTGWRSALADCFGILERNPPARKFRVDFLLVYNTEIGRKFLQYIDGEVIAIGSYKNNHVLRSGALRPRTLTFISQYRRHQDTHPIIFYDDGRAYLWENFYEPEKQLLPLLADYCRRRSIPLRVCATSVAPDEYEFFAERIGDVNWDFIPRFRRDGSYHVVDRALVVVTHESTLAYEAFGRGVRTAFFSTRGEALGTESLRFGWPGKYADHGPFWTTQIAPPEVERILDGLFEAGDAEWEQMRQAHAPDLMEYDPGNSRLLELWRRLGVPLTADASVLPGTLASDATNSEVSRATSPS